ncbi:MAG: 50S ribosomal protein L4 [Candidatus Geothermarchaeota archaeon]
MAEKVPVYDLTGEIATEIEKPLIFYLPIRKDLIERVYFLQLTHKLQPKGRYPLAGKEVSAEYFGTGLGLARIPRYKTPPLRGRGAFVAMARGGRRPHVTPVEKKIYKKINYKELKLATATAIAATGIKELVSERGHIIEEVPCFPLVVVDELESISNTKELVPILERLGLLKDIERVREKVKITGGKAAWRGRRKKSRIGPLIVYSRNKNIALAARNLPGVDVQSAKDVSVLHLAPGGKPGRLTLYTLSALETINERFKDILERYMWCIA